MNKDQNKTSNITCVIIDDDPFITDLLMDKLTQYFPEITVIAVANNGQEGIDKLLNLKPKLVFLDVEMYDMTGFEMLLQLPKINFKTIFITSYNHYAIKAIRFNALDYLLKPIDLEELKNAIARYRNQSKKTQIKDPIHQASENFSTEDPKDHMLILNLQEGQLKLYTKEIQRIQGDRNYSQIYLANNQKKVVTKTLSDLIKFLDAHDFFRCHKSHIVNRMYIKSIPNRISLVLNSGLILPVSRRKRKKFFEWVQDSIKLAQ